jgi:putative methionine-R-sulfoxide reductase with GAF domain
MIPLRDIASCFEGVIPAMMSTCSLEGEPNVTEISQVHLVDETHVALSHQFFNKTQRNVRENPHATVQVFAPVTYTLYRLQLRFDHSESEGPLFEEMSARLQVIASHTGMLGIFKLRCADVYEVVSVEKVTGYFLPDDPRLDPQQPTTGVLEAMARELRSLRAISDRVNRASCLEALLENALQALDEQLGFRHAMVLLPDDRGHLVTTASHGYGSRGVGAEVPLGEGLIGTVAARRRPMRVAGVGAELRYWRTIRAELQHTGEAQPAPEIPLPGLPDAQAQLALPLLLGDRLVGVLALESREAMAFDAWTETFLNILANQIALGIDRASSADDEGEPPPGRAEKGPNAAAGPRTRVFQMFRNDDCIFVDGEYLIRNIPAKILWKLLRANAESGRTEFSNRELRLDDSLGLPELRDNLESRLILLRKRLEEKCPDVQIRPVRRGRFELQIGCAVELRESESA